MVIKELKFRTKRDVCPQKNNITQDIIVTWSTGSGYYGFGVESHWMKMNKICKKK